ncbi:uncharacterized protein LOC135700451 [Ochlerotatus camptorhynchus]|uniref:uncharacterized protein LOC135700451 n=1 Tax=Ochlerotatus camptorhynchus TaxID=644619 RepID=UPI0031E1005B
MDVHGRLFLISSFAVSFTLSVASKLLQEWAEATPSPSLENHFRLVSDGAVLVLHFIYLVSSRDSGLVPPADSFRFLLKTIGPQMARVYVCIQFMSSIVGSHYMSLCACDIIVEYVDILLEQRFHIGVDQCWRRWIALASNLLLTIFNCCSVHWTTPSYGIYMKVLFISFWMAKIWLNFPSLVIIIRNNWQHPALLFILTIALLALLVAIKELKCFPPDTTSANQTVLLPLYEHLVGVKCPELPVIVSCFYAGSMNSYFLSLEPSLTAAQLDHLPSVFKLFSRNNNSPILLLIVKFFITATVVVYLSDDYDLLGSTWNCLFLISAFLFDFALVKENCTTLVCTNSDKLTAAATMLMHVGFQLANLGWIYHRLTGLADIIKSLFLMFVVTKVIFKLVENGQVIDFCINTLKLECHCQPREEEKPPIAAKGNLLDDLV